MEGDEDALAVLRESAANDEQFARLIQNINSFSAREAALQSDQFGRDNVDDFRRDGFISSGV